MRILRALALILCLVPCAHANRAIMEMLPASNNAIYISTLTPVMVGIGISTPGATLDVNGNAQFGANGNRSTFTSTGNLQLVAGSTVTTGGGTFTLSTAAVAGNNIPVSLFMDKNGKFAIGSSTTSNASYLSIGANPETTANGILVGIFGPGNSNTFALRDTSNHTEFDFFTDGSGNPTIGSLTNNGFQFTANNSIKGTMSTSGVLFIGGTAFNTHNKLEVNGSVGIGTYGLNDISCFDANGLCVSGATQLGYGVGTSTFSSTGALTMAANAALILSGASGNITNVSSITANSFFGDGSHLTGISGSLSGGTAKYIPVWTGSSNIGFSEFYDTGSSITASVPVNLSSGIAYGSNASTQSYIPENTKWILSVDGATQSSGTVMALGVTGNTGDSDYEVIASTTDNQTHPICVLVRRNCAAGTMCECLLHGLVRVNSVIGGCSAGNQIGQSATRGAAVAFGTPNVNASGLCETTSSGNGAPAWIRLF